MIKPSTIHPDTELRDALQNQITVGLAGGGTAAVPVYGDWERPTNELPADFLVVFMNGDPEGLGMDIKFVRGYMGVSLYCKLNDDGSLKKNRINKILDQFEALVDRKSTTNYFFEYDTQHFITPSTPNYTTGYSVTTLNLKWTTNNNFNL